MVPVYSAGDYEKTDRKEVSESQTAVYRQSGIEHQHSAQRVGISIGALGNGNQTQAAQRDRLHRNRLLTGLYSPLSHI